MFFVACILFGISNLIDARVTLYDLTIAKLKQSTQPSQLRSPDDILGLYDSVASSSRSVNTIDNVYELTLIRELCNLSGKNTCAPIGDRPSAIRLIRSLIGGDLTEDEIRSVLGLTSNDKLNSLVHSWVSADNLHSVHFVHSQLIESLWGLQVEEIPQSVFAKVGGTRELSAMLQSVWSDGSIKRINLTVMHRAARTGVFSITELPDAVIKYYSWCKTNLDRLDAIVLEAFFMEKLSCLGIAPRVYYYSDAYSGQKSLAMD